MENCPGVKNQSQTCMKRRTQKSFDVSNVMVCIKKKEKVCKDMPVCMNPLPALNFEPFFFSFEKRKEKYLYSMHFTPFCSTAFTSLTYTVFVYQVRLFKG